MDNDGFVWTDQPTSRTRRRGSTLATRVTDSARQTQLIRSLELRIEELERQRTAWEQERAAWMLAATARPVELVLSLPSVASGLSTLARRAARSAPSALRQRVAA